MYKIEKNIPQAPKVHGNQKYPFYAMEVGDSFLTKPRDYSCRTAASNYGKNHGMKFSSKTQSDGSFRIWRIE